MDLRLDNLAYNLFQYYSLNLVLLLKVIGIAWFLLLLVPNFIKS